jgi:hypothetical protein
MTWAAQTGEAVNIAACAIAPTAANFIKRMGILR